MVDILIFLVVLVFLIVAHEGGHFFLARRFKMYVEEFGIGFPPRLFSRVIKGVRFSVNALPLGGFVKIPGEDGSEDNLSVATPEGESLFSQKPIWQRALVLLGGVFMNFVIGWLCFVVVFSSGVSGEVIISQVGNNTPAQEAGFMEGDAIKGFDSVDTFTAFIDASRGEEVSLTVLRDGEEVFLSVVPRVSPPEGEGSLGVGIIATGIEQQSFLNALGDASMMTLEVFWSIFVLIGMLIASIFGGPSVAEFITGPVGIFHVTSAASAAGIIPLIYMIGLISINLSAINIVPFPALDGGRLVFLLIEKIKGSPVSVRIQQMVNGIAFLVLIGLIVILSIADINRFF